VLKVARASSLPRSITLEDLTHLQAALVLYGWGRCETICSDDRITTVRLILDMKSGDEVARMATVLTNSRPSQ